MKVLLFAASLRKGSFNRRLAHITHGLLDELGVEVDHADFHEFDMPLYDGDVEAAEGMPAGAVELDRRIRASDAVILSIPEYNASIPGTLKNAIDWLSRFRPHCVKDANILILTASPSLVGGMNCHWAARIPLQRLGAFVYPYQFTVPQADKAFTEEGKFADEKQLERLRGVVAEFIGASQALLNRRSAEQPD